MVLFKRIICINNITPDPCGHSYSELKFEDRCRRDFPVSLSVGIWNHGRLKHGLATWGPLVWVLKKPEKYNMLFTYILHRLSILWERRSPDTSDEIKCKPKSCMTTHPVLGKFACSVCFFVMVTQGWLVKSLFIKGFFYRISLAEPFLSLLLAPLPNTPSLSTLTWWKRLLQRLIPWETVTNRLPTHLWSAG